MIIFIKNTIKFCLYLSKLLRPNFIRNNFKSKLDESVNILANGPSLIKVLNNLNSEFTESKENYIVMNFFAFEELFFKIKPHHYCFADPMFYRESHRIKNVLKLFEILDNRVNWEISLYIPSNVIKDFIKFSNLTNLYLKIIPVNVTTYSGFNSFRNYFYRKGLASPPIYNVSNLAIYVALLFKYKNINLYGLDHTFFDSLCVNHKNEICYRETHFYTKDESKLSPIRRNDNGNIFKMSDYLDSATNMFKSHDLLSNFAKYLNLNVVNKTKNSLVDSYIRELKINE